MPDTTPITQDVTAMVKKTWCEGPLTVKVNISPPYSLSRRAILVFKACCSTIGKMLMIGFYR